MLIVTGTFICGVSAGSIGFLPTGAWVPLAILRFFVGFGLAAGVTPALTIVVELTPTRWRTGLTSFYVVFASAGTLLASFTSATLLHAFGWRGVAMTGFVALIVGDPGMDLRARIGALADRQGPLRRGARGGGKAARRAARERAVADHRVRRFNREPSLSELYSVNPRLFWQTVLIWGGSASAGYGYYLWGPTIVSLALHVDAGDSRQSISSMSPAPRSSARSSSR